MGKPNILCEVCASKHAIYQAYIKVRESPKRQIFLRCVPIEITLPLWETKTAYSTRFICENCVKALDTMHRLSGWELTDTPMVETEPDFKLDSFTV
jgi:protein-arginine kinase activator protein McsA